MGSSQEGCRLRPVAAREAGRMTLATGEPILQLEDVHKSFGSSTSCDGVDLTIKRGEVVCVLGP